MIELTIFDKSGESTATVQVDEKAFGGVVRRRLLKQAVLMYEANKRQGTAATKSKNQVEGSTRKLYRQKGTGHARAGASRSPSRRGGGVAFGPHPRDYSYQMPRKALQQATRSALLAKFNDGEVKLVDSLAMDGFKTKQVTQLLGSLGVDSTCLLVSAEYSRTLLRSARNIPGVGVAPAKELNAYDILKHRWLVIEKPALDVLVGEGS